MAYANEFPHSTMFDSDLRQILELFESVKGVPALFEDFKTKFSGLVDLYTELKIEVTDLKTEVERNEEDCEHKVSSLTELYTELKIDVTDLTTEVNNIKVRLDNLETELGGINAILDNTTKF